MHFEKRAYLTSLYVTHVLSNKYNFKALLDTQKASFMEQFSSSSYYFMWPFKNLEKEFDEAIEKIQAGQRPYEDPVFDMLDDLLTTV
jgi:hypothetical protein